MGFLDKFLDAIKLNDDYDDDEEFLDDDENGSDDDDEEDYKEEKPKKRFFQKFKDDEDDDEDADDGLDSEKEPAPKNPFRRSAEKQADTSSFRHTEQRAEKTADRQERGDRASSHMREKPQKRSKITPIRKKGSCMEVNVIRPSSMEDTREIADTLIDGCTVVLNLEGLDVDIAQRVIDFTCGACYSLEGSLQKISSYIFILTPSGVDISGDFQSILNGAFNELPSMKTQY